MSSSWLPYSTMHATPQIRGGGKLRALGLECLHLRACDRFGLRRNWNTFEWCVIYRRATAIQSCGKPRAHQKGTSKSPLPIALSLQLEQVRIAVFARHEFLVASMLDHDPVPQDCDLIGHLSFGQGSKNLNLASASTPRNSSTSAEPHYYRTVQAEELRGGRATTLSD